MGLVTSTVMACFGCWSGAGSGGSGRSTRAPYRGQSHPSRSYYHQHQHQRHPHGHAHTNAHRPILFYDKTKPYYEFTNFSPHAVVYKGKRYPTSEHLFQAFKFIDNHPHIAERIRTCSKKPMRAFDEAHKYHTLVRLDWPRVRVEKMQLVLELKFTQDRALERLLLNTGNVELVEDSPRDWFWGIGADGTGSNELGKALMRLRDALRRKHASSRSTHPPPRPSNGTGR